MSTPDIGVDVSGMGKSPSRKGPLAIIARLFRLDLDQVSKEIKSTAPFLIPFVKMTCVFFVLDLPEEDPSPTAAFVKALPVLSLAWLVCLHGVKYGDFPSSDITYNRRILYGLLFSIVGDVLLIWQRHQIYFMLGMLSFACGHICYIMAFGYTPFGLKEFIPSLVGLIASMSIIYPCVQPGVMSFLVPVYAMLLCIMGWRSLACFTISEDIPWKKILCAIGAFLFVISDIFVGVNKFCYPIPFERPLIMCTYYAAQLCISLSVINFQLSCSIDLPPSGAGPGTYSGLQMQRQRLSTASTRRSPSRDDGSPTRRPSEGLGGKPQSGGRPQSGGKPAEGMKLAPNRSDPNGSIDLGVRRRGK